MSRFGRTRSKWMTQSTATLALLAATAIWGWTFTVVKEAVAHIDVLSFLFWRFFIASFLLAPRAAFGPRGVLPWHGIGAGCWLTAAYLFQTYGLRWTSPTNSGLITGMFVLFTPLIQRFVQGRVLRGSYWLWCVGSFLGLAFLTAGGWTAPNRGDTLTLGAAICFAAHVVFLEKVAAQHPAAALAAWQFFTATGVFGVMGWWQDVLGHVSPQVWPALLITGVLATTVGFLVQTWAQQRLPAVRVAVILTGESAFAAFFGVWLAGDRLTALQWFGAALMFGSVLAMELSHWKRGPG